MVEYLKSKKGYFYKLEKNGKKKRISEEEYNKKNITGGVKQKYNTSLKTSLLKPSSAISFKLPSKTLFKPLLKRSQLMYSDIMYKDKYVCILKPKAKRGIIVRGIYIRPKGITSLCKLGLKSGKKLHSESVEFGRNIIHSYIFFRAPYISTPEENIDYSSIKKQIISSYGEDELDFKIPLYNEDTTFVYIRVDPNKTFVFSSDIRINFPYDEKKIQSSIKTLSEYLKIIEDNKIIEANKTTDEQIWYNLFTSKAELHPLNFNGYCGDRNWTINPIKLNSEILVQRDHLTPDFFVYCKDLKGTKNSSYNFVKTSPISTEEKEETEMIYYDEDDYYF